MKSFEKSKKSIFKGVIILGVIGGIFMFCGAPTYDPSQPTILTGFLSSLFF